MGKVSSEEFQMTTLPSDTAAEAVVLGDYGSLKFDLSRGELKIHFDRHRRLKILKRAGFGRADVSLSLHKDIKMTGFRAQTIQPNGEEIKVKKEGIFEEMIDENWRRFKIAFPEVKEGSIIEYSYQFETSDHFQLPVWYFQEDIPVVYSEYRLYIPEWYNYVVLNQGRPLDVRELSSVRQMIAIPAYLDTGIGPAQQSGINKIHAQVNVYHYAMKNVPAMREEAYITTMDDYRSRIRFQLASIQFPQSPARPVLSDWQKLAKELDEFEFFGGQYQKKTNYKNLSAALAPLVAQAESAADKAEVIYRYLANEMKWNEEYSFLAKAKLDDCFDKKKQ